MFDTYSKEQLRELYAQAWLKHLQRSPLSPLEALIVDVVGAHPEYQATVADRHTARTFDPSADGSSENPFLHMGLHLAVREQLSIDRPPGVRDLLRQLQAWLGDAHAAEHALMEALSEALWQAQRDGHPPDEQQYLALAKHRLSRRMSPAKG